MIGEERYTASNHYISALYHLAVEKGLDGQALLRQVGVDPAAVDAPQMRVRTAQLAAAVQAIWDALSDESMGLASEPCRPGTYYLMGKLTVHQPTLRKALALGIRYYSVVSGSFVFDLEGVDERVSLKIRLARPELDPQHLLAEMTILAWHRYLSWLIAEHIPFIEVWFDYPAPAHMSEYGYLFPSVHYFERDSFGFSFPASWLEREVVQTETSLKVFMNRCPVELFLQQTSDFTLSHELRALLRRQVDHGFPSLETVADTLCMTPRTLMRKLKEEGSSFQRIKDLVRRDQAMQLLGSSALPLSDVADRVGFSDPAVFSRAFKHWTGMSPSAYRAKRGRG